MIFKQLFEPVSSTYTYLLGCEETGQAVLVDPVINAMDRDMQVLQELGLRLAYTLDTHIHADHITSALELKKRTGSRIAAPAIDRLPCVDFGVEEATPLAVGSLGIRGLHTPGHTEGNHSFVVRTPRGLLVTSENGVGADSYAPLASRIPGLRRYAQDTGVEVILNGNTQEGGLDQYLSMIQEKEIAEMDSSSRGCRRPRR